MSTLARIGGPARAAADEVASNESDEDLVRQSARGEEGAFARLLERYGARIAQLVRWQLGRDKLWAEDVAQDVFVQLHRRASTFQGRSSFKSWLYAVAFNVCRDHLRRQLGRKRQRADNVHDPEALADLPDGSLDPFERLEQRERETLVREAVERLTPAHRTVLLLRDWEDLSYEEIGTILDLPVGTVRSRLHNARAALARGLAGGLGGK